jgi:hypothetical protein
MGTAILKGPLTDRLMLHTAFASFAQTNLPPPRSASLRSTSPSCPASKPIRPFGDRCKMRASGSRIHQGLAAGSGSVGCCHCEPTPVRTRQLSCHATRKPTQAPTDSPCQPSASGTLSMASLHRLPASPQMAHWPAWHKSILAVKTAPSRALCADC